MRGVQPATWQLALTVRGLQCGLRRLQGHIGVGRDSFRVPDKKHTKKGAWRSQCAVCSAACTAFRRSSVLRAIVSSRYASRD